jgi:hypothetical protein
VNACCIPHCPRRGEHYRQIGSEHIRYWRDQQAHLGKLVDYEKFECPYMSNTIYDTVDFDTRILPDEIYDTYVPMGFRQFKIEGRSAGSVDVIDTVIQYMAKPEFKDQARLKLLRFVYPE